MCIILLFLLIRACEEEGKARMGVVECLNHHLVEPYNVLYEKEGEVCHIWTHSIDLDAMECYIHDVTSWVPQKAC